VVELDGMTHVDRVAEDERRTRYLQRCGLEVIRFTNDDVLQDLNAVAEAIARAAGVET